MVRSGVEQDPLDPQLHIVEGGKADAGGERALDKVHAEALVEAPPHPFRPGTERVKLGTGSYCLLNDNQAGKRSYDTIIQRSIFKQFHNTKLYSAPVLRIRIRDPLPI